MKEAQQGRQRNAAGHTFVGEVEKELIRVSALDLDQLRREWEIKFNAVPPSVRSRNTLLRLFAWQIQAAAFGSLDGETERRLRDIAKALERDGDYQPKVRRDLAPGIVLTREWKGVIHQVTVEADGFQHLGKRYDSLSDIARTITGTRWSGPRFFSLEPKELVKPRRHAALTRATASDAL